MFYLKVEWHTHKKKNKNEVSYVSNIPLFSLPRKQNENHPNLPISIWLFALLTFWMEKSHRREELIIIFICWLHHLILLLPHSSLYRFYYYPREEKKGEGSSFHFYIQKLYGNGEIFLIWKEIIPFLIVIRKKEWKKWLWCLTMTLILSIVTE